MLTSFNNPFETLLTIQRALDARRESDWMAGGTAGFGSFPPINGYADTILINAGIAWSLRYSR